MIFEDFGLFGLGGIGVLFALVVTVVYLVATVVIIRKAGFNPWWVLVTFVPILGTIMFFVFAFVEWPALRAARIIEQQTGLGPPPKGSVAYGID